MWLLLLVMLAMLVTHDIGQTGRRIRTHFWPIRWMIDNRRQRCAQIDIMIWIIIAGIGIGIVVVVVIIICGAAIIRIVRIVRIVR